jgi:hypothetical protein
MKWRLCVIVLIGCLGADRSACQLSASDQPPDLTDQALPDVNRPADPRDQPNEMGARIAAGLIETDNVERTATDPMSDTIEEVSADVAIHEQTRGSTRTCSPIFST